MVGAMKELTCATIFARPRRTNSYKNLIAEYPRKGPNERQCAADTKRLEEASKRTNNFHDPLKKTSHTFESDFRWNKHRGGGQKYAALPSGIVDRKPQK